MKLRLLTLLYLVFLIVHPSKSVFAEDNQSAKVSDQIYYKQFQQVFERIKKDYVHEPDRQKMTDAAINGMLTALDPHSCLLSDENLEDFINHTKGEFGGIGVEVMFDNGAIKIISPIDDLPAYRAGIKPGDYIVEVNNESVSNLGFHKAIKEMRGEPGTKVKLLVLKENENKSTEVELTRELVKIKPIKSHLEKGNVAYIRIVTFNESTTVELRKHLKNLEDKAKGNIKGIVLDLRNNPGGLLNQAVSVGEVFIESGVIVSTKGRISSSNDVYTASKFAAKAPKVPMVVIINSGSASASEIIAGSLQDHKRAIIMGTKSFGKASVQTLINIDKRSAFKLTTAQYFTPHGRSIQAEGIEPDIIVEQASIDYPKGKANEKRFSESSLKNYLKNDQELAKNKPEDKPSETANIEAKKDEEAFSELYKKDYQYARACDLVVGLSMNKK